MLLKTEAVIEQRRKDLELYLRQLLNRMDTRHAKPFIQFLELDSYCPEMLYKLPTQTLFHQLNLAKQGYVNKCFFVPDHNILALTLKKDKKYALQLMSFAPRPTALGNASSTLTENSFYSIKNLL